MNRIWTVVLFLVRDLFASLAGIAPVAAAVAFGLIAFEYGMDQTQFITVAALGFGSICLLATLLLAHRANRASVYPLVARLRWRAELLAALVLGGLGITVLLALLITAANLLAGRLTLSFPSVLWIIPTWLPLWVLAAVMALLLSALVGRGGSHIVGYVLLTALLVVSDQKAVLASRGFDWLNQVVTTMLWPIGASLSRASAGDHDGTYYLGLALVLAYVGLLGMLALQLFEGKDLLWPE